MTRARRPLTRDRDHLPSGRHRQLNLRYSDDELAALEQAAKNAGLTPSGYAAEAALAVALGATPPRPEPWREALIEVMAARTQVSRLVSGLNQALQARVTSDRLPASESASALVDGLLVAAARAVERLDRAADDLARRLR
jgi:hypothetical protein